MVDSGRDDFERAAMALDDDVERPAVERVGGDECRERVARGVGDTEQPSGLPVEFDDSVVVRDDDDADAEVVDGGPTPPIAGRRNEVEQVEPEERVTEGEPRYRECHGREVDGDHRAELEGALDVGDGREERPDDERECLVAVQRAV